VYDSILIALPDLVLFPGEKQQQLTEEKMCYSISICDETVCDRPAIRRLIM
jgi:hypothetical protein